MRHLSFAAQLWIWLVLLAGALVLVFTIRQLPGATATEIATPTFWVFLTLAAAAHAFPVTAARHQAYHATHAFLMAAILLLSWPAVALIVVVMHAAEWLRRRRPWYIQLYNVGVYLLSALSAAATLRWFSADTASSLDGATTHPIGVAIAAAGLFLLLNHFLTAIVLRLARGVSVLDSGLFGWESLGVDGTVLLVGIPMADAWLQQPLSLVLTSAPLALFFRALRLPGLERNAHRERLTDLYNARHLAEMVELELARAHRFDYPTTIVVASVGEVQHLLQRYGRATVDFLAIAVAERLASAVRDYDVVARLSEGSFGLLLPNTDQQEACSIARHVLDALQDRPFDLPTTHEPVRISASAALATIVDDGVVGQAALAEVERAAERSRLSGPGTVVTTLADQQLTQSPRGVSASQSPAALRDLPARPSDPESAAPAAWHFPGGLRLLETVIVLPTIMLSIWVSLAAAPPRLELAASIVGLVVVTELLAFELYDRASFSISFVPILAAGLLAGPDATMLATWTVALVRGLLRRSRWDKVLFNGSVFTLFGLLATLVATATGLPLRATELSALAAAGLAASMVYYLHTFLVAVAVALDIGADPRLVWARNFRWLFPHYLILGLMGVGLAVATDELGPLGTLLFLAPPLMMRFVLKQYTDRTIGAVEQLRSTNADLRAASRLLQRRGDELALLSDLGQLVAVQSDPHSLVSLIAERCVPTLGDVCAFVWAGADAGRAVRAAPGAERIAESLAAQPLDVLQDWAAELTSRDNTSAQVDPGWAISFGGYWAATLLPWRGGQLGWLLTWRATSPAPGELADSREELTREVARRLALALEREALLEEAATIDAVRAVDRAKSDFIAIAAHELRTPLTSIQGYAELLGGDKVEPGRRERWLSILQVEAAQVGLVLDQLLDVSRLESGRFNAIRRPMDLSRIVQQVVDGFAAQAALDGHSFEVGLPARLPRVFADPSQIERVLRNIVSNALKYSPHGGRIRVSTALVSKGEIEIRVEDDGLGIPSDWLDRVFGRFERVKTPEHASIRGTGLGLYIARQLVELNGGRIWATSPGPGRGAVFHVILCVTPRRSRGTLQLDEDPN